MKGAVSLRQISLSYGELKYINLSRVFFSKLLLVLVVVVVVVVADLYEIHLMSSYRPRIPVHPGLGTCMKNKWVAIDKATKDTGRHRKPQQSDWTKTADGLSMCTCSAKFSWSTS